MWSQSVETFNPYEAIIMDNEKVNFWKKIFEKRVVDNPIGRWNEYYLFGKKVYTKLIGLYRYE